MNYLKIITRSFSDFFRDDGITLAAALSYFSIMASVPLCLFLIAVFGHILGQYPEFYQFFSARLINFFPAITEGITNELGKLITFRGIGTLSILLYGFFSLQVFTSIDNALNIIFKVKKKRAFFLSVLMSASIVTFLIIMLLVSFAATSLIPLLQTMKHFFPELRIGLLTAVLIRYVIPFFMVFFSIAVMYVLFPKTKVRMSHAFTGALFATVFLEIAKHVFTWYVGTVAQFGTIYGPLTAFVVFLLWAFYSACIFLIGAEMVHILGLEKKKI